MDWKMENKVLTEKRFCELMLEIAKVHYDNAVAYQCNAKVKSNEEFWFWQEKIKMLEDGNK